jgi:GH25 family lysozyme M1 (1,4-beta-N-acetylmuramidase)
MTILGIGDASENDTSTATKWDIAKSKGIAFGIVRATTTGAWVAGKPGLREDGMWTFNASAMNALGIKVYPYIWFDPRPQLTGAEQGKFFCDVAGRWPYEQPVIDIENAGTAAVYGAASLIRLKDCVKYVFENTGKRPLLYSYPSFIDQLVAMGDVSWMSEYPFIVAHWDVTSPRDPYPWWPGAHKIWQYTANMLGSRYGFFPAAGRPTPRICMAVMED